MKISQGELERSQTHDLDFATFSARQRPLHCAFEPESTRRATWSPSVTAVLAKPATEGSTPQSCKSSYVDCQPGLNEEDKTRRRSLRCSDTSGKRRESCTASAMVDH